MRSFKKFVAAAADADVADADADAARVAVPCRLLSADVPRLLWHLDLDYRPAVDAENELILCSLLVVNDHILYKHYFWEN